MARRSVAVMCSAVSLSRLTSAADEAVVAQAQRRDQGAVDDQVGVAADRRGEVGVAVQVQPEVADVVGGIDRLHLGAQHDLVDDLGVRARRGSLPAAG